MLKLALVLTLAISATAGPLETNNVYFESAPPWVTRVRVEKIIAHIQMVLAWDIRKVEVKMFSDEGQFAKAQNLGPRAMAVTNKKDMTILLGPKVNTQNFDEVFGHELVHIIAAQKYKASIPPWLEEGLASYLARAGTVDYKFLASQPFPDDVRQLTHPYAGGTAESTRYHYQASQALVELIKSKCDLENLLQMSVGESFDTHLSEACGLTDLNVAYRKWVKTKGG